MNCNVNNISARLSLRKPQKESLEILSDILERMALGKQSAESLKNELIKLKKLYPSVTDFERDFPSLCFALATGVGKTRLMGAFIAYLYITKRMKNFFVLAPNLTIYNKLIQDFTPHTPKYVFKGISELAINQPRIITGDNYEEGIGVRKQSLFGEDEIHINIFNISKINSEVRGGKSPRIKRLSEYIGQSYFEYLASLPDLVLLMDESHRYRASAGVKVLNELNPVLGIELTATPQIETSNKTIPFNNVIYSYPLYKAMEDGFVKEPAVATRPDFTPPKDVEELEKIKLEDGILVHEETKVELEVYAKQNHLQPVKPFVLIVAQDTKHAEELSIFLQSDEFFNGSYKGKVITVHSNQRGEEKDETIQELMALEDPNSETEIVIHVNMLKEGWDVTNLYTIIPLRAANSKTLVEQSIGRGLRLPYGKRTGVKTVDRLTIIAHDKFQEIVDEANNPNSIIRTGVIIGKDVAKGQRKAVTSPPVLEDLIVNEVEETTIKKITELNPETKETFTPVEIKKVINLIQTKIQSLEHLPSSKKLNEKQVKKQIIVDVQSKYKNKQLHLFPEEAQEFVTEVVETYLKKNIQHSIDIPRILVQPVGGFSWGYKDFNLNVSRINLQPVGEKILIQHLRTHERETLQRIYQNYEEERLEDYIVNELIEYSDISYDEHVDLLYKLTGQLVCHLQSYLPDESAVRNVLQYNRVRLAELIHLQMKENYYELATAYEVTISKGFETLKTVHYTTMIDNGERQFREPVEDKSHIKSYVFSGFLKCLYRTQKFDSDSERRYAIICESDDTVEKWFKPALGQFKIYYGHSETYNPDFIVETKTKKYICEIKKKDDINDKVVQEKAKAVQNWCSHATEHELKHGGKEWIYLLIPHNDINENMTVEGLTARYRYN
ncbi:DEAD/DEAH box helicase family protein [Bacillus sp. ISL-35]|uniref:DEAD/DEAH box helicase family protein n=1 Tax=Bacillus sp. ISL-35 TaxID=2819122 RepID=UPI001BE68377|nr:DEAD/DEAH box helicase family protein [Bacillus sp. ISL-35]MBT2677370.1 DEAD/DEAH box helicase family protein [Bacillus sp. ISL-35]MBT2702243.1 DEAD/DEAH box helicase family protein [Chryseobacterium sp. ISL-80]